MNYLTDIESLRESFFENQKPYWKLFHGSTPSKNRLMADNQEIEDMDESWELVMSKLMRYQTGTFCLAMMPPQKNAQIANAAIEILKLPAHGHGIGGFSGSGRSPSEMFSFERMMAMYDNMERRMADNTQGIIEAAKDEFKKEQQIRELRSEIRELKQQNGWDRLAGMAMDKMPQILDRVLPSSQALGTVGMATPPPPTQEQEEGDIPFQYSDDPHLSIDQLVNSALRVQQAIPDVPVNHIIQIVADFAESNPEQARQIILSLEKQE